MSKRKPRMIHWDTLQEDEHKCVTDNGGTRMKREDDAVFLYLRPDHANAPAILDALGAMVATASRVVENWERGDIAGAVRNLDEARRAAQEIIHKVERENNGKKYTAQ